MAFFSLNSGITNTNGLFTLYDVEVSEDTTFTATYSSVSATCKVEYCLLVDYATTNKHTDVWNNMDWFTRADDGTLVYYKNTGSSNVQRSFSQYTMLNGQDAAIDLELVECTRCVLQTGRYQTGASTQYESITITQSGKVHIEIKSNGTYFYLNGNLIKSDVNETNQEKISFFIIASSNTTANFKYKDLRIYYI